jgi:NitT/TauT family transport system ATP-binding protein
MSYLDIRGLCKSYDRQPVLERISVSVAAGEFVTLVGASGCGKTTFLKILLGVEQPTRGEVLLEQKPLKAEPDSERGIVFQRYSVFPHLTVRGNVLIALELQQQGMGSRLWGRARREALVRVDSMIERVGLAPAAQRYPHELSGGMQQRLALAQALIAKPKILLLDEPFGALDPGIRVDMHELVNELWQEEQLTVFMITHDISEAFALGTRLWVFDKVRRDPQAPDEFGARITYDLPIDRKTTDSADRALPPEMAEKLVETHVLAG